LRVRKLYSRKNFKVILIIGTNHSNRRVLTPYIGVAIDDTPLMGAVSIQ